MGLLIHRLAKAAFVSLFILSCINELPFSTCLYSFDGIFKCLAVFVWHYAISVFSLSLEGISKLKMSKAFKKKSAKDADVCLQLCFLGSMPPFFLYPAANLPLKPLAIIARAILLGFLRVNKQRSEIYPLRGVPLSLSVTILRHLFKGFEYAMRTNWHTASWLAHFVWYKRGARSKNDHCIFRIRCTSRSRWSLLKNHPFTSSASFYAFVIHSHLSHRQQDGISLTSMLRFARIFSVSSFSLPGFPFIMPDSHCAKVASPKQCGDLFLFVVRYHPPRPCTHAHARPALVLTGWHRANLPLPSLSFVAHSSVALPPVSTFPSHFIPLISFLHFLNR